MWAAIAAANCGSATMDPPASPQKGKPTFVSFPSLSADHNREWSYVPAVTDPDGDIVTISPAEMPAWARFDAATSTLSGIAGRGAIGDNEFRISASDGDNTVFQTFTLQVSLGEILCDADFGPAEQSPYILPFRAGASYRLGQGNCPPNPAWGHHNWFAYDFLMPNQDTVLASRGGLVRFVQSDRPNIGGVCGQNMENFVFIEHEDGTVMHYMHLFPDGVFVSPGQTIEQGAPIALSGNSGCSAGPHLHVAAFRDATSFDRRATLPVNYSNAIGPVTPRNGLVQGADYQAGPGG